MGIAYNTGIRTLGAASPFPTTWPNTTNPVGLSGVVFTLGGSDGLLWQNPQTTGGSPGIAWGTGSSPTDDTDNICTVQGRFSTSKHYSQITGRLFAGYLPPDSHEIELLLGFTISANSARGYEMDFGLGTGGNPLNLVPVRWNGNLNDFTTTVFTTLSGSLNFAIGDGDVCKGIYDSTSGSPVITMFLNGVQQCQITDTTAGKIVSGSPGQGFFARPGAGLDLSKYCNKGFDCGNA